MSWLILTAVVYHLVLLGLTLTTLWRIEKSIDALKVKA
jgi:multisubunit Na+/H+ antiporter MnhC subunit